MGRFQEGEGGVGLSPHIQACRPVHTNMARAVALGNYSPGELARMYGYSKGQISRIMGSPAFQAEVSRIQQSAQLVELDMSANIKLMTEKAITILDEDMEVDPDTDQMRKIRQNAALEVLNIAGVRKSGGNHIYLQNNDNRTYNVNDLDDNEIRDEITELTRGKSGTYGE